MDAGVPPLPGGWHTLCSHTRSDGRQSHIGPHRLTSDGWAWMLPHSQPSPRVGDASNMVYVRRTFTWLFTGLTLLAGLLWLVGWSVWHTKNGRNSLSHRDDDQMPPNT